MADEIAKMKRQVMLDGCKFRIKFSGDNFAIPIRKNLRGYFHTDVDQQTAMLAVQEVARMEFRISKPCAQAYLDLYEKYEDIVGRVGNIEKLLRGIPIAPVHKLYEMTNDIGYLARNLVREAEDFLVEEQDDE